MTAAPPTPPAARARPRVHREVVSFVRRSARLTAGQRTAWQQHASRWVLDVPHTDTETSIDPDYSVDLAQVFGREAPLVVEIGSGTGDSLVPMAAARAGCNVLAFEVYQPAVAQTLAKLARAGVDNVRLAPVNAVEGLATLLDECSLHELWLFFPDPWPKSRHHKRRLLTPAFADLVATRLQPGAMWRLATDWEDYALQMRVVLDAQHGLENLHPDGWAPRWEARPVTRFEQRGRDAGRSVHDLTFRCAPAAEAA